MKNGVILLALVTLTTPIALASSCPNPITLIIKTTSFTHTVTLPPITYTVTNAPTTTVTVAPVPSTPYTYYPTPHTTIDKSSTNIAQ
jgi:hypothetical protein